MQSNTNTEVVVGEGNFRYRVDENWPQLPDGVSFEEVVAIATDSKQRVYVFNRGKIPVAVFDRSGRFISDLGVRPFVRPHGITISPNDTIFCVDDYDHTIRAFTVEGTLLQTLGVSGQYSSTGATTVDYRTIKHAGSPFNFPTNLAVAKSGDLYITDGYGNSRVHCFSSKGELRGSWGEPGSGPGEFNVPHGIAIDASDRIYVADRENSRIQRFSLTGKYLDEWTDVVRPCEVFIDPDGIVYIAELGLLAGRWPGWPDRPADAIGGRLSIFDTEGALLARWGGGKSPCAAGDFFAPHDVWVDAHGDIYVSEVIQSAGANRGLVSRECHTLQKFSRIKDSKS